MPLILGNTTGLFEIPKRALMSRPTNGEVYNVEKRKSGGFNFKYVPVIVAFWIMGYCPA